MNEFQKLGIFLNEEPGDDEALAFAGKLAEIAKSESILCVHVRGVEDSVGAPAPNLDAVRKRIREQLTASVADRATVEVHEGTGIAEILRSARDQSLDLIVVGRRQPHDQMAVGSAFARLARKAPCSVFVVPDESYPHFGRLLVPVDCSEHSMLALRTAIEIARTSGESNPQVVVQTIFQVGYGYQYTGLTFSQAVQRQEEVARKKIDAFMAGIDSQGVQLEVIYTCSSHPSTAVYDLLASKNLDLIVVGSRGMSSATAVLIGSFAEQLIIYSPAPVLVVKRKGETLRFLDALLRS